MTVHDQFLANIKRLTKEQNISNGGISRVTGMSDTHIAAILKGKTGVTLRTIERFAKVFNVQPWEMLK